MRLKRMKKIGFVTPWYGENIPGGAEMELRGIATHIAKTGLEVEILTTCVKDFNSDWNEDYYDQGEEIVTGILVRRFKVRKRNVQAFNEVNYKLMNNLKITRAEEQTFIEEMVNSPDLYEYIKKEQEQYQALVYIPYMFGTTYYGIKACPKKAIMIPCFHDESYIYMDIYKQVFESVSGVIYHAKPEMELANRVFDLSNVNQGLLGEGVHTEWESKPERFKEKYQINFPYIMYAGRKDAGKNVDLLIQYFAEYKKRNNNELKLILIGGGQMSIPRNSKKDILDLGFIDMQDKYDAYGAALALCQPSTHESFSLVIMESWLCNRPVLVHEKCEVTKNFAIETRGGLYFDSYFDFEGCLNYYINHPDISDQMGKNGCEYVHANFSWDVIVDKYVRFIEKCVNR